MNILDKITNKVATLEDQEGALTSSRLAYRFALLNIPGTDIEKCQEAACKNTEYAYYFALDVPGADIEYCQKKACKVPYHAYEFAKNIPNADIEYCRKACENSIWKDEFDLIFAKPIQNKFSKIISQTLYPCTSSLVVCKQSPFDSRLYENSNQF